MPQIEDKMYPSVSIILRVKNEGRYLGKVINAILEQDYPSMPEIIVVDSGSTDDTLRVAGKYGCRIVKINPEDFTFGRALNIGYKAAKGDIFVNLSGHSIPTDSKFLRNLVGIYEDPIVMASFGRNVPLPEACPSEARDLETWFPDEWLDVPDRFSNGNSSLRRAAWERIPFDENVSGSEDIIWAKQLLSLGFRVVYVPTAAVYHSHSASLRYVFERRLRETKAIVAEGQDFSMPLSSLPGWVSNLTKADFSYARQKGYSFPWLIHIPLYRTSQGLGICLGSRKKGYLKNMFYRKKMTLKGKLSSFKGKISAYRQKSIRVIKDEGFNSFFFKARRKIVTRLNLLRVPVENLGYVPPTLPKFPTPRKFKVMFIVDPVGHLTNHYRADNMKEYLSLSNIESEVMPETELNYQKIPGFDVVVLCRVFMNYHIEKLVEMCGSLRIPVVFDVDDFVIDTSVIDHIPSLQNISDQEKSLHVEGIRKHRASLDAADFLIVPTDYLAQAGRDLEKRSFVIRNGLSSSQMQLCKKIMETGVPDGKDLIVRIGYFSGTKSHQRDFSIVVPALQRIMKEFDYVHLYIGGHLDIDSRLEAWNDRIKKLPFVDIATLPHNIARVDINIAPLELDNPFCQSKSELKYFDAALLKIPTVASPTDAFKWAIQSGVNGFLASSEDEWYSFLKKLVEDQGLRSIIGQRAYEHADRNYTPEAMAPLVRKTYEAIISEYRDRIGISKSALSISFVIPPPIEGSGGHNKIFTAAKYLYEFGHHVRMYFLNDGTFAGQQQLSEFLVSHFFDSGCEIIHGTDNISPCDILCATSWITAYTVRDNRDKAARLFYFVQDIEFLFFPMSDNYLKAENTYRFGMHHVTYGPWCAKVIREKYRGEAEHIPLSLDKKIYHPRPVERESTKRVIFFSRPEMPRRCFWLGLEALYIFNRRNPDVKIILFGSSQIDSSNVPFPHENLGMLSKDELVNLYSSSDVGVAFSTTNPSLVPFEMMACRCPVVDLDYNDNYINYGSKDNAKLVGIGPEEIAAGIEELVNDDVKREEIAENGYRFVSSFPDDGQVFKIMGDIFLKACDLKPSVPLGIGK